MRKLIAKSVLLGVFELSREISPDFFYRVCVGTRWSAGSLYAVYCSRRQGMRTRFGYLAVVFSLLISTSAFAQKVSGTVTGTVTDQQGAVAQGATVTITDAQTNFTRTATTGPSGTFVFPELDPGAY